VRAQLLARCCLCVTAAAQVQGGGVAVVIGAQVWSLSAFRGNSIATVESTVVSDFSVILHNCRFSGGNASTVTTGGAQHDHILTPGIRGQSSAACMRALKSSFQVQAARHAERHRLAAM
jgi:hypothetical protein